MNTVHVWHACRSGQMTIPRSARLPLSIGHLLESECPYHGKSQKNTPRISLMTVIMTTMLAQSTLSIIEN